MYPGATLCYGIVIPDELDWEELPWVSDELLREYEEDGYVDFEYEAEKVLKKAGLGQVDFAWSGHLGYGETVRMLCVKNHRFYAYEIAELTVEDLQSSAEDNQALGLAWSLLFPSVEADRPKWLLSLSYG
jgi:hypothetical protein